MAERKKSQGLSAVNFGNKDDGDEKQEGAGGTFMRFGVAAAVVIGLNVLVFGGGVLLVCLVVKWVFF